MNTTIREDLYKAFYKPTSISYGIPLQILVFTNIFVSILVLFLETEKSFQTYTPILELISMINTVIFILEYTTRLYIIKEHPLYKGKMGRLRYAFTPMMIIDLIVILPFIFSFIGIDLHFLRALRALRIFKLFRLGKFAQFDQLLLNIIKDKKEEFIVIFLIITVFLFTAAPLVYYFEHEAQPEAFASMFDALWWAIITFTTVGYGDMYPVTIGGRIVTVFITVLGISLYAIPGSIFTAALLQKLNEKKQELKKQKTNKE